MRASSRANKGQFNKIKYEDEQAAEAARPKPAKRPRQQRQSQQIAIPAIQLPALPVNDNIDDDNDNRPEDRGNIKDIDTVYWKKYFYTPDDDISRKYFSIVEYYEKLPASMIDGLGNLEVKEPEPIKQIPSFRKLVNGDYQTATSKSDKNISASIKFFVNNLPSFQQFKNNDNLDWVVTYHRLLTTELLEYSLNHNSSIATVKSKFNAITRILRLAFKSKTPDLYEKFSRIVSDLGAYFEDDEFDNMLSPEEEHKFITWDIVIAKQKQLERQFYSIQNKHTKKAYELNNDLLLLSLYSLIPPLRNEIKHLNFTIQRKRDNDYIWLDTDGEILLDLNLEKKRHEAIYFSLTKDAPELANIIRDSYSLYPREYVFTPKNTYPNLNKKASQASLDARLKALFAFTGKNVSVNSLRSSYVSYMVHQAMLKGKLLSVKEKNKIAEKMRSSRKYFDESYTKLFQMNPQQQAHPIIKQEDNNIDVIDEMNSYERQKARAISYYHQHKDEIIRKQKEYQQKQGSFANSRNRLLRFLNSSPDHERTMKETTKTKYDFKKVNGRWV